VLGRSAHGGDDHRPVCCGEGSFEPALPIGLTDLAQRDLGRKLGPPDCQRVGRKSP
jgi:hypothetical protein